MIDRTFDPTTMIAAAREAFAPVLKAQQEGFKTSSAWRGCSTPSPATCSRAAWRA